MSIFPDFSTKQWAILIKSLRDAQIASISDRKVLGKATSLPGAPFGPICSPFGRLDAVGIEYGRSEEHKSELQSLMRTSYADFCLKKNRLGTNNTSRHPNTLVIEHAMVTINHSMDATVRANT